MDRPLVAVVNEVADAIKGSEFDLTDLNARVRRLTDAFETAMDDPITAVDEIRDVIRNANSMLVLADMLVTHLTEIRNKGLEIAEEYDSDEARRQFQINEQEKWEAVDPRFPF